MKFEYRKNVDAKSMIRWNNAGSIRYECESFGMNAALEIHER